jgi:predicted DNA-binding transcriptional regulator AlpA
MIDAPTQILTIDELATFLKMTRRQVYNLTRARGQARMQHPLPVLRINGNVRFRRCDVETWLAELANDNNGVRR